MVPFGAKSPSAQIIQLKSMWTLLCLVLLIIGCASQRAGSKSSGPFEAEYVSDLEEPEILIKNETHLEISVELNGPQTVAIRIAPNSEQSKSVSAGTYNYHASAPGVTPLSGSASFDQHYRYVWSFMIVRR
jgi:hypothetical protein